MSSRKWCACAPQIRAPKRQPTLIDEQIRGQRLDHTLAEANYWGLLQVQKRAGLHLTVYSLQLSLLLADSGRRKSSVYEVVTGRENKGVLLGALSGPRR